MIRRATIPDRPHILLLMKDAHEAAEFNQPQGFTGFHCPWSLYHMERCLDRHMRGSDSVVIVLGDVPVGILLAIAYEHPFGPVRLSKDTVWWIDPKFRGLGAATDMLDHYEAWAKSLDVTQPGISGMGRDPRVGVLLERRGYCVADTHWIKRV